MTDEQPGIAYQAQELAVSALQLMLRWSSPETIRAFEAASAAADAVGAAVPHACPGEVTDAGTTAEESGMHA